MDPASTLVGLAEVSLALAGFAAIVLVLGTRGGALEPEHSANVRVMVLNAVASAFFFLLCIAVLALEVATPFAWRLLSMLGLVALFAGSALNQLLFLRHVGAPNRPLTIVWWSFAVAGGAIQLVNALGVLGPPSFGLLFLGLVVVLSQAGAQFVHMVFALLGRSAA
jgi:lipid-A-disaccharide synthase-like uncharacterized protein